MRSTAAACLFTVVAALIPDVSMAAGPLERFALIVGANFGGADRPRLQYAIADAERFARVMTELGGVSPGNEILLKQPKLRELVDAIEAMSARVAERRRTAPANGGRTEIILYYSGHADEKGLLLGEDRYSYRTLRDRLDQIHADVRIVVLDACASGAFTRLKGGRSRPPFVVDESATMRGHAFLTSSAATEAAQESDRIRASYFTHYLVSGLRGAADLSGDGRITLNEAYQFAFGETLGGTVGTRGGAQHPSYDINMSGTGEVVMTDVRQTTSTLVLGEEIEGRFFVRNAAQELVVELYKPFGRRVELGVEPGKYEIRVTREKTSMMAHTQVDDGARVVLDAKLFTAVALQPMRARGDVDTSAFPVTGRNRFDLRLGTWRVGGGTPSGTIVTGAGSGSLVAGLQYARYLNETLAVTFAVDAFGANAGSSVGPAGVFSGTTALVSIPIGVRWNPFTRAPAAHRIKSYVVLAAGPVIGSSTGSFVGSGRVITGAQSRATVASRFGAGVDFHVGRHFMLGLDGAYNAMADFNIPIGTRDNYSGFDAGLRIGFVFGGGRQ